RYQDFLCAKGSVAAGSPSSLPCVPSSAPPGSSVSIRELPSFSFSGMDRQVGNSPLFFSFDTSAAAVGRAEPGLETGLAERLDFHSAVTLRTRPFWGFLLPTTLGFEASSCGTRHSTSR